MSARRPTLADVARAAGVSLKTASRALNGEPHVSAGTATRVRAAAHALDFRPNRLAQVLRSGASLASIALVTGDLGNPFWSAAARGVEREVAGADLLLVTASHEEDLDLQERLVRTLVERRVDGLVLVPAPGTTDLTAALSGVPVVALDRPLPQPGADEVVFDDRAGAATAVLSLLAQGHRRIAFVGAEATLWTVTERLAGYTEALARARLEPDPALVRLDCPDTARAATAVRELLRLPAPPTALLAMNGLVGRGALRATRDSGARLEITAFDPDPDADLFSQAPSTIVNDPEAAGRVAAGLLLDRLQGDRRPPRRVVLTAALVVRPATGGARLRPLEDPAGSPAVSPAASPAGGTLDDRTGVAR
jgi:LacI family transcriptional regulator